MSNHSRRIIAILTAIAVVGITQTADAQRGRKKKIKPACDITAIPFVVGTEWVYKAVPPPTPPKGPLPKPRQPATVTIKVMSVEVQENKEVLITLEEKAEDKVYNTKLTCQKDALRVPPESFYFSGELGGGIQIQLGEVTHKEPDVSWSYRFTKGKLTVPTWIEELKAPFTRTASEGSNIKIQNGSVDLQRNIIVGWNQPENLETDMGPMSATPMQVDLRGSVILDMANGPQEFSIPANTLSKLWIVDGIGVVQVYNTNVHMFQLMHWTDPNADPAAPPPAAGASPAKK